MLDRATPKRVLGQVQLILREEGGPQADIGKEAVKAWVCTFVQAWVPGWDPSNGLTEEQAVYLGQMFEALVRRYEMAVARRVRKAGRRA